MFTYSPTHGGPYWRCTRLGFPQSQGSHRCSENDAGDWKLPTDRQVSTVKGATIRAMRSPRPCSRPCVFIAGGDILYTRDRVLGHGSSAMQDLKIVSKHEQSDLKLGTRIVRLEVQFTTLSSLMGEAQSVRVNGKEWRREWRRELATQKRLYCFELRRHD